MIHHCLHLSNLTGGYGNNKIFQSIDLQVKPGEIVGLIGPNGGGKTTLLRHVIGYLKPSQGKILVDGNILESLSGKERGRLLAYVPQESPGAFEYTLQDLVSMGRYPYEGGFQTKRKELIMVQGREVVDRALSYVGLQDLKDRPFSQLSGGEKHRGLFARALAQETPYLILDEPTANLDLGQEHLLFGMLRELAREGRGILTALHNLTTAAEYCHRLVLLFEGKIATQGRPEEVLTKDNLAHFYHAEVVIGRNENTDSLLVLHNPPPPPPQGQSIHLIAGAGSGMNLTRHLVRRGYRVTGGVAHAWDSDSVLWDSLSLEQIKVDPFSPITPEAFSKAVQLVKNSGLTILCDFPLGLGNAMNLDLAEQAENLVILESTRTRQWFAPGLEQRFSALMNKPGVRVLGEGELVGELAGRQ